MIKPNTMNKIRLAYILGGLTLLFYIVYNTHYGWNEKPINDAEALCDKITVVAYYLSIFLYFSPLLDIYEDYVEKKENENN